MYRKANQMSQYILADAIHIADTQNLQESGNRIKSHNEGGGKPQWDSVRSKRGSLIKMWGFFFKLRRGGCVESKRSWEERWIERMIQSINKGLKMKELRNSLDKLVFLMGGLHLMAIINNAAINICTQILGEHTFSFFWDKHPGH